jgi:hypothetical protein
MRPVTLLVGCSTLLVGCAAADGPYPSSYNPSQQSAVTMTAQIRNVYKPGFQPTGLQAVIFPAGASRTGGGFGQDPREGYRHKATIVQRVPDNSTEFVLFVPLSAGEYVFTEIIGQSLNLPINGTFVIPLEYSFRVPAQRIVYLGRLEAVNRERRSDQERRAGPVMPLLDQSTSGFSGGTFDITIRDNSEEDLRALLAKLKASRDAIQVSVVQPR